jgi:hypothetical protein
MRIRVTTGDLEGAVGELVGYGSDVSIVVLDGHGPDAIEIPTGLLEQIEQDGEVFEDPDPTRCEVCGQPWADCRCPEECQLDHSGPAGICPECGR